MGQERVLNDYLRTQRGKPFQLGRHDCFTFTNGAWRAMHGAGYADQIIGKYHDKGPKGFRSLLSGEFGFSDILDCLNHNLQPVGGVPPRGALVVTSKSARWFTGRALGIAFGVRAIFVGDGDLVYMPIGEIEGAWVR